MKLIVALVTMMIVANLTVGAAVLTTSNTEAEATYRDIQNTLGVVPSFMKAYPKEGISAAWEEFKNLQLNRLTVLSGKEKELIGLAVASQIPCQYCIYFHTITAKMNGATDNEVKEAIAMSAATRHWSTYLNGVQYSEADFKKETDTIVSYLKTEKEKTVMTLPPQEDMAVTPPMAVEAPAEIVPVVAVVDAKSAYYDIEHTLGSVPNFFKLFPENAISGAWKMMKTMELNPNTALSGKDKELIGLGVAAQVPCQYCTYFHTEAAKLNGASEDEIHEAIAMASLTRFWSTMLNGSQINEKQFKKEVAQIQKYIKSQTKRIGMNN